MVLTTEQRTHAATDLLQQLIRNACVNDGTQESGHEVRSAELLRDYLAVPGLEITEFEPSAGRRTLVARMEGRDAQAPSLTLMGHTDVVPANPDGWSRDPFGGDLDAGFVWGRGAVDMLNLTATMAVAMRELAESGFRPRGTLTYIAIADEEAQGGWGADWLLQHHREEFATDYIVTEMGGFQMPTPAGVRLPVIVGEKGTYWCTLRIGGTPGHASLPYRTDNALVTAAEVVRRIATYAPRANLSATWLRFVEGMAFPPELAHALLDPEHIEAACAELPLALGRQVHACTHTSFAPTVMRAGTKTNVIPDRVDLELDIRTLPGVAEPEVRAMLAEALGDLSDRVEIIAAHDNIATASPVETPLWDSLAAITGRMIAGSALVPHLFTAATDNRFFRRAGSVAYGFGLFSQRLSFEDYGTMFHGNDERIDVESLGLSTDLWVALAEDFWEHTD
ncbi:MAG: M20/M25/M40 family metallo-hydrolase [Acidimicrobiia bacterium]